jgi:hypothetical protein
MKCTEDTQTPIQERPLLSGDGLLLSLNTSLLRIRLGQEELIVNSSLSFGLLDSNHPTIA